MCLIHYMNISVADIDLQIRVGPVHTDPEIRGGGGILKMRGVELPLHLARVKLDPLDLGPVV